jgi:hypothetical protein
VPQVLTIGSRNALIRWSLLFFGESTVELVVQAVEEGLAGTPSVRTFVMGIGNVAGLDAMAAAGGTEPAHVVGTGSLEQEFLVALETIVQRACP